MGEENFRGQDFLIQKRISYLFGVFVVGKLRMRNRRLEKVEISELVKNISVVRAFMSSAWIHHDIVPLQRYDHCNCEE